MQRQVAHQAVAGCATLQKPASMTHVTGKNTSSVRPSTMKCLSGTACFYEHPASLAALHGELWVRRAPAFAVVGSSSQPPLQAVDQASACHNNQGYTLGRRRGANACMAGQELSLWLWWILRLSVTSVQEIRCAAILETDAQRRGGIRSHQTLVKLHLRV